MLELAELVLELTGSASELMMKPLPADDPTQRQPDITLAKINLIGNQAFHLTEGLQRPLRGFQKLICLIGHHPPPTGKGGLTASS